MTISDKGFRQDGTAYFVVETGDLIPLSVSMGYDSSDPFAVTALFRPNGQEVEWIYARDLVIDALANGEAGMGDIQIKVVDHLVYTYLSSPDGTATIAYDIEFFTQLRDAMIEIIPIGSDTAVYDKMIDDELMSILTNG